MLIFGEKKGVVIGTVIGYISVLVVEYYIIGWLGARYDWYPLLSRNWTLVFLGSSTIFQLAIDQSFKSDKK